MKKQPKWKPKSIYKTNPTMPNHSTSGAIDVPKDGILTQKLIDEMVSSSKLTINAITADTTAWLENLKKLTLEGDPMSNAPGPSMVKRHREDFNQKVVHPIHGDKHPLNNVIMDLNDRYEWTREQIADWLDTLDSQPIFYPDTHPQDCNGCDECNPPKYTDYLPNGKKDGGPIGYSFKTESKTVIMSPKNYGAMAAQMAIYAEQIHTVFKSISNTYDTIFGIPVVIDDNLTDKQLKFTGFDDPEKEKHLAKLIYEKLDKIEKNELPSPLNKAGYVLTNEKKMSLSPAALDYIQRLIKKYGIAYSHSLPMNATILTATGPHAEKVMNHIKGVVDKDVHSHSCNCSVGHPGKYKKLGYSGCPMHPFK